jgi:hypothetical protein
MIKLKKLFKRDTQLVPVKKEEKEVLECFIANKGEFENWLADHPQQRVCFRFYYPTAIDFYFDDFKLFTAFFKPGRFDVPELAELKMTEANTSTICSADWKPFEEVIVSFLKTLEQQNKVTLYQKTKSLHDYAAICKAKAVTTPGQTSVEQLNPAYAGN